MENKKMTPVETYRAGIKITDKETYAAAARELRRWVIENDPSRRRQSSALKSAKTRISSRGTATLTAIKAWKMKSIWEM